jgi:hypothetical protein
MGTVKIEMDEFVRAWDEAHTEINDDGLDGRIARRQKRVDAMREKYEERSRSAEATCSLLVDRANVLAVQNYDLRRDLEVYRKIEAGERETLGVRLSVMRERIERAEREQKELDQQYAVLVADEKERQRAERMKSKKL